MATLYCRMVALHLLYHLIGSVVCLYFVVFAMSSIAERRLRAALVSVVVVFFFGLIWFGPYLWLTPRWYGLVIPLLALAVPALLFFAPLGRSRTIGADNVSGRVDERDVMFAREEYQPGTEKYDSYYAMRPENRHADDRLRKLPPLLAHGGRYYDSVRSAAVEAVFNRIESLTTAVDGEAAERQASVGADGMTEKIKAMVSAWGAVEVGVARLDPMFVYSHVGRGPEG